MNFTAELEILAEIMGGLESTGITGLLWYLGYAFAKYIISAALIAVAIWVAYKICSKLITTNRDTKRLVDLASLFGFDFSPYLTDKEYRRVLEEYNALTEQLAKYREKAENRAERLGNLSAEYELCYERLQEAERTIETQRTMIRKLDDSINSDYDKEEASGIRTEGHDDSPKL